MAQRLAAILFLRPPRGRVRPWILCHCRPGRPHAGRLMLERFRSALAPMSAQRHSHPPLLNASPISSSSPRRCSNSSHISLAPTSTASSTQEGLQHLFAGELAGLAQGHRAGAGRAAVTGADVADGAADLALGELRLAAVPGGVDASVAPGTGAAIAVGVAHAAPTGPVDAAALALGAGGVDVAGAAHGHRRLGVAASPGTFAALAGAAVHERNAEQVGVDPDVADPLVAGRRNRLGPLPPSCICS